jgi:hypothetical protein
MAEYERINWEDVPSKLTPINAENLNKMDEGIDTLARELAYVRTLVNLNTDIGNSLAARISALIRLADGTTTGDAELADGRISYNGVTYESIGDAIRAQVIDIKNELAESSSTFSASLDSILAKLNNVELSVLGKVDGAYVQDGYLYMTANDEVVVGPLGPFSGEGGGGSGNAAVLTVTNTSGWLAKTISYGTACPISINWTSLEDEIQTGPGMLSIIVNGATKAVRTVQQGDITLDVSTFLNTGANTVKMKVTDVYDNSRTINYSITLMALTLASTFDTSTPFTGAINFPFIPTGNVSKLVHFIVDGHEIGTTTTSVSGRQVTYTIPAQTHGSHSLRVYFEAEVEGQTVLSNELYYDMICKVDGNTTPIIASDYDTSTVAQYASIPINFYVYDPSSLNTQIELRANGKVVSTQTVDRTMQTWTYRANEIGELTLVIACGTVTKSWTLTVVESEMNAKAETEDLVLYLSSHGRSNNEANPDVWEYEDISATFAGFNWSSDGWVLDADQNVAMRVSGDARVTIPYHIFADDFRGTGKTIEFEFETRDVRNYDSVVISCYTGDRGIVVTPQSAKLKSEQSEISMQYKENEHVRVAFVVEKRSEYRLIYCYVNGVISGVVRYPESDDFSQVVPVGISIGSSDCTTDIYNIRIYDNDLTRYQMLNNWIADTQNVDQMLARFRHNNVFDEYGQIVIAQLPQDLPYMVITCPQLPQYKGDKKTVRIEYTDPLNPSKSFTSAGVQLDVQGTSSQYYARKNYKAKFKKGFTIDEVYSDNYELRDGAIPTNVFCFKADVASSEGANNVELVRLYEAACPYKTPAQEEDSRIRQGIDGFPMVIFWNNGTSVTFIGKYNFNYDKSSEVFGFGEGDESWEIRNNTGNRVIWKSADFSGSDWLNDFEARYPDTDPAYEDATQLAEFASFLVSTDQEQATGNALAESVTYGDATYTNDTAEYRLAKFKAEIGNYTELQSAMFYYLFTELFLMVDSRAKNAFPSFIGMEVVSA